MPHTSPGYESKVRDRRLARSWGRALLCLAPPGTPTITQVDLLTVEQLAIVIAIGFLAAANALGLISSLFYVSGHQSALGLTKKMPWSGLLMA